MTTILIATRNAHKVQEIATILGPQFRCISLRDLPETPEVIEDAPTFAGNAAKKAAQLSDAIGLQPSEPGAPVFVLADDSGLEVDALDGAPGVHSARFASLDDTSARSHANSPDTANNAKLLRLLQSVPVEQRAARFRCVLAFSAVKGASREHPTFFEGVCEGRIALMPSGQGGFGYDPLFVPAGYEQSFAELGEDVKNQLSHRAKAVEKLRAWLTELSRQKTQRTQRKAGW